MSYTPLLDPIFTGNPRVPTASFPDNDTTAASTGFVSTNFVALTTAQTITGAKTFDADVTLSDNKILFDDMAAASSIIWDADVSGDTNKRISVEAGGKINWGSGSGAADATLERVSANVLQIGADDFLRLPSSPVNSTDAVNKAYVDALSNGQDVKASVRLATAAALPANTRTGNTLTASANGALSVDGVAVVNDDRILVKDEATAANNGIYVVTDAGSAGTPFILDRASDADVDAEVTAGMFAFVTEGSTQADTGWVLSTNDPITLNTTALTFNQFASITIIDTLDELTDVTISAPADGQLFRYESASSDWRNTGLIVVSDAGQVQVPTTGSAGGLLLGGDAQWYRSAADTMRTPDALVVDGTSTLTGLVSAPAGVLVDDASVSFDNMALGTTTILESDVTGDTQKRLVVDASGKVLWGSGSAVGDTNLYRSAANVLKTDDAFHVAGLLQALGNADIDGTLTVDGTSDFNAAVNVDAALTVTTGGITVTGASDFNSAVNIDGAATLTSTLSVTGKSSLEAGVNYKTATKTAAYSVDLAADHIIFVDTNAAAGAVTITLPATHSEGDTVVIKDSTGAAESKNIIIDPADADTIDGLSTYTISVNYQGVTLVSDGTNWLLV